VVVRYRENNPESVVREEAQKLADQANKTWTGVDKVHGRDLHAEQHTNNNPRASHSFAEA
jgi:hypothetical protein